jgi:hypothetical protein
MDGTGVFGERVSAACPLRAGGRLRASHCRRDSTSPTTRSLNKEPIDAQEGTG